MVQENRYWTRKVLKKLKDNRLYCWKEKCVFEMDKVEFLRVTLGQGTVKISKKKMEAITKEEPLTTRKALQRFLEITNYHRKFIKGYSSIARPLHELTKDVPYEWNTNCQEAFKTLQEALVMAPVLTIPRDNGKFRLETNASDTAMGAVLSQV
jgi:hypothetical protein